MVILKRNTQGCVSYHGRKKGLDKLRVHTQSVSASQRELEKAWGSDCKIPLLDSKQRSRGHFRSNGV